MDNFSLNAYVHSVFKLNPKEIVLGYSINSSQIISLVETNELTIDNVTIGSNSFSTLENTFERVSVTNSVVTSDGKLGVLCRVNGEDGDSYGTYFGLIDTTTKSLTRFTQINEITAHNQTPVDLINLSDGSLLAAFYHESNGEYIAQKINSDGSLSGSNVEICFKPVDSNVVVDVKLVADENGGFVAWGRDTWGTDTLRYATYDSSINETQSFEHPIDASGNPLNLEISRVDDAIQTDNGSLVAITINGSLRLASFDTAQTLEREPQLAFQTPDTSNKHKLFEAGETVIATGYFSFDKIAAREFDSSGNPLSLEMEPISGGQAQYNQHTFSFLGESGSLRFFSSIWRTDNVNKPYLGYLDTITGEADFNFLSFTDRFDNNSVYDLKFHGLQDDGNLWVLSSEDSPHLLALSLFQVNQPPSGDISFVGAQTQGSTLQVDLNLTDIDGMGIPSYQWLADGEALTVSSNQLTLTQAHVGKSIQAIASYTDGNGTIETITFDATSPISNVNDLPSGSISLNGTTAEGQTLSLVVDLSDEDGLGNLSYQWFNGTNAIDGATTESYVLKQSDVGASVKASVTYTDGFGATEVVWTDPSAQITNVNNLPTGNLLITGSVIEGETLTLDSSTINDLDGLGSVTIRWLSDGLPISSASDSTYLLSRSDVGAIISAQISYVDAYGTAETVTSAATAVVDNVNIPAGGSITIVGDWIQGSTLTVVPLISDADGLPTQYVYQWYRDGIPISGSNSQTYTPSYLDVGRELKAAVLFTDLLGGQENILSSATDPILELESPPNLSGSPASSITAGNVFTYTPLVSDPNGNLGHEFRLLEGPDWAVINKTTGQIAGTPTGTTRIDDFIIEVTDPSGLSATQNFSVTVLEPVAQLKTLSIPDSVGFIEIVGDSSANSFNGQTNTIMIGMGGDDRFTTSLNADFQGFVGGTGSDRYVLDKASVITVVDGGNSSGDVVEATRIDLNSDLTAAFAVDQRHLVVGSLSVDDTLWLMDWLQPEHRIEEFIFAGESYTFNQFKSKVEGLSNYLGNLTWIDLENIGSETVSRGIDATSIDELEVNIRKILDNSEPGFDTTPDTTARVGYNYTYNFAVNDPDIGDAVNVTATHLPSWATFDSNSNTIGGVPDTTSIGQNICVLTARDSYGGEAVQTFFIDVRTTNNFPLGKPLLNLSEQSGAKFITIDSSDVFDADGIGSKQYVWQLYREGSWVTLASSSDPQLDISSRALSIPATNIKLVSSVDHASEISGLSLEMVSYDGLSFTTSPSDTSGNIRSVTTPKGLVQFTATIPDQKIRAKMLYEDLKENSEAIISDELVLSEASNAVNISDAVTVLKKIVGLQPLTDSQQTLADVNGDQAVNISDAVGILKHIVGLDPLKNLQPFNLTQEQSILKLSSFSLDNGLLEISVTVDHNILSTLSTAPVLAIDLNASVTAADDSLESLTWSVNEIGTVDPVVQGGRFTLLGENLFDLEAVSDQTEIGSFQITETDINDLHKLDFSIDLTIDQNGQNQTINEAGHLYFDGQKIRHDVTQLNTSEDVFALGVAGDVDLSAQSLSFTDLI